MNTTTASVVNASPSATTSYLVVGRNSFGCSDTAITTVTVSPAINVSVSPSQSICSGAALPLSATGASTYSWTPSAGLSATTGANVIASPAITTTYTVTGYSGGCSSSANVTVTVAAAINVAVSPNQTICVGDNIQLVASGAVAYSWTPFAGLSSSSGATVNANPITTTTYNVTGTSGACSGSANVTVNVNSVPNVTASPNQSICAGGTLSLFAYGGNTYSWSPAYGLNTTTGDNVLANPPKTTNYIVTGTNGLGCKDTAKVTLTINQNPQILVISEPGGHDSIALCNGKDVKLFASGAFSYVWSPSADLNQNTGDIVIAAPLINTTYNVVGTDLFGCSALGKIIVSVVDCHKDDTILHSNDDGIIIFPNPSSGNFSIEFSGYKGKAVSICIENVNGQIVIKENWQVASDVFLKEINLKGLAKGIYFLKVMDKESVVIKKLIVN